MKRSAPGMALGLLRSRLELFELHVVFNADERGGGTIDHDGRFDDDDRLDAREGREVRPSAKKEV